VYDPVPPPRPIRSLKKAEDQETKATAVVEPRAATEGLDQGGDVVKKAVVPPPPPLPIKPIADSKPFDSWILLNSLDFVICMMTKILMVCILNFQLQL
jgi:hypothetical protein